MLLARTSFCLDLVSPEKPLEEALDPSDMVEQGLANRGR
jgi:hypothetical protein